MQINYKRATYIFATIAAVLALSLLATFSVLAGNINSSAPPGPASSYTLADIYNRLNAGTDGAQSAFATPVAGPGSTMYDLNTIMAAAPALDNTNGATTTHVLAGQTFWGLTSSQWATQTGSIVNNGAGVTIVPTTTDQSVAAGYWSSANTVQGDADLDQWNIRHGATIFGVTGKC